MILFMAKKILMSFAMSTRDKKKEEEVVLLWETIINKTWKPLEDTIS